ncbi:hypothetical protein WJX79_008090 [Trebouxia sp. C0005]
MQSLKVKRVIALLTGDSAEPNLSGAGLSRGEACHLHYIEKSRPTGPGDSAGISCGRLLIPTRRAKLDHAYRGAAHWCSCTRQASLQQ